MLITELGIVIDVNDVQPWKAESKMSTSVAVDENVTDVNDVQP